MYKKVVSLLSKSPVLTWGGAFIFVLLLVYPLLNLWDVLEIKHKSVAGLLVKVKKIEQAKSANITDLREKTLSLEQKQEALLKHFRTTPSVGLVKVDIREWLESLVSELGLKGRVSLDASELQGSAYYPHWIVSATLTGQEKPEAVLPLIRNIEESEYFSSLVQVSLSFNSYQLLVDMVVLQKSQEQE